MTHSNPRNENLLSQEMALEEIEKSSNIDLEIRTRMLLWVSSFSTPPRFPSKIQNKVKSRYVFSYWHAGINSCPPIVRACIESHKKYFGTRYIFLDSDNIADWVEIPEIINKARSKMSETHFSDVLRLLLLERHGGVWVDSTVLLTGEPNLHPALDFFCFTRDRDPRLLANWWIEAKPSAYIVERWLAYLIAYWEQHDQLVDYFIMHHIFEALYVLNIDFRNHWNSVPTVSANPPHILQANLNNPYDPVSFNSILKKSNLHKLTWKLPNEAVHNSTLDYLLREL